MDEPKIAVPLLTLLASGGTLERIISDLPAFRGQIEASFDWMKVNATCTTVELEQLASHLRQLTHRKLDAINNKDFDLAADIRARESAIFESVGLKAPAGATGTIFCDSIEKQVQDLSTLLTELKRIEREKGAAPNGGPCSPTWRLANH